MASLIASGLSVGRGGRTVLRDLDLMVWPGERLAVVGANGSGKTTLLRALAGLDRPLAGEISWDGGPLPAGNERVRAVGVLFQGEPATPFSVTEMVALGLALDGPPDRSQRERVLQTLRQLGLTELAHRRCTELSGGEWQRVALARALVGGARLLLLDEPGSHLDPGRRAELLALLERLPLEVSVVLATHDLELAATCDRVLLLGEGRALVVGDPPEVLTAAWLARALGLRVRRLEDPEGGPPLFRILGSIPEAAP
jgi:iron complex transport system ATP-binding protein